MIKEMIFYILGFLSCIIVVLALTYGINEESLSTGRIIKGVEISPSNRITEKDIILYEDRVVIMVENASISSYAPSGSMRPVLDEGSNGIRIVPKTESDVRVGDIVSFMKGDELIIHRVIKKGIDSQGVYFITKGDNSEEEDGKVRFKDIKYVTVGILY